MMFTRLVLLSSARQYLSKTLLIGLRYSVVRRQFRNITGQKQETKLLDYQTQQMKLFPLLAMVFAQSAADAHVHEKYG